MGYRYKGIKGRFWAVFSEFIRKRDFKKYGTCISCGKKISSWKDVDAGHYMAASSCGFALLFDERNVNGECKYDNGYNENHQPLYANGLDERYGEGTANSLLDRYKDCHFKGKTTKEWTKKEYEEKIAYYKQEIKKLDKKGIPSQE